MTWKIELGALAVTAALVGGILGSQMNTPIEKPAKIAKFSQADFNTFERNFEHNGAVCSVGVPKHDICFGASPLSQEIAVGDVLPANLPALPAPFKVILELDNKRADLVTYRYGHTLALVDRSRRVVDTMEVGRKTYARSRPHETLEASTSSQVSSLR